MFLFIVIIFILTINYTQQYKLDIDCMNSATKGANYKGTVNRTVSGNHCIVWKNAQINYNYDHNYCRNPDNSPRPWCYADITGHPRQDCNITYCDCRNSTADLHYKGHINTTISGHACRYWKDIGSYKTEEKNYCRTPTGDADNAGGPWCYSSGGRWERCNVPVCGVKRCPNLTDHLIPKDGKSIYHYGETVYLSCETGYHLKGDKIISCEQSGNWNPTMPICEEISCTRMSLHLTDGVQVIQDLHRYTFQKTVTMSCKSGFIGTTVTSQCTDVNKWSHTPPICTKKTCTKASLHLSQNVNVRNDKPSYDYNEEVSMSCNTGFTGKSVTARCTDADTWSANTPICTRITCTQASLQLIRNVNVTNVKSSYNFLDEVTMSCNYGFSGNNVTARCTGLNTWSEKIPTCTMASCPRLNLTPHMSQPRKLDGYHHKDEIHFGCDVGYYLVGSLVLSCLANGKWSSQQPTCKAASCPVLPKLPQLHHIPDLSEYIYNDTVTFQCDVGFLLTGPALITCTTNNRQSPVYWNGKQPNCTAVACPGLYEGYSIKWSPNRTTYSYNDIVHFQCDAGYQLSGPSSLVCQANDHEYIGHWSKKQPACVEEYNGVSKVVFGVVVALIIVVAVAIITSLMCFVRIKLKDSNKQYEDIKISMDQLRNHNEDQIYSELSDTQQ